ncbi:MAG: formylglycine-generating enzyme family protein [Candidatus Cardinium sp.]|uniref:formylglycine-generating enzyme family protein n=1 Tax=Candidatus Cardinium sp. TP TaxID=2961955 RepID=UPI0021B065C7|nr:formylglycine-generating enzyme family protein [Candidatus Cardinium sp. TP]MCT4696823.1 formylglycine-generating enzyme family protein [Candidatus Cardinium sp. TP]MDN5246831.1 formylglycine-generating enzyme family protein [Candidatus Cardinium sp.]
MVFGIFRFRYLFFIWFVFTCFAGRRRNHPTSQSPGKVSQTTGRPFNQPDTLSVVPCKATPPIPGMVYIEGGYMIMGNLGEDKLGTGGCSAQPVTVNSFWMDEAPITNLAYREYLYDLKQRGLMEQYQAAMPNQQVFIENFSYNDPLVDNYLYAPGFMYYPVVGVSWEQAMKYCAWRTQKLHEAIKNKKRKGSPVTETAEGSSNGEDEPKRVGAHASEEVVDGLPIVRLATEAEFEYAARAVVGVADINYLQSHQRNYPWDGSSPRGKDGRFLANFKRGKGNYKGMAGESDHSAPTSNVYAYPPNLLGLYDMVGNVCCWVYDTYRPVQDTSDLNPVRRDGLLDSAAHYSAAHKASLVNDDAKVYKGCSWADCAYFLQIGTRRYLNKDAAAATIGFRCVVSSLGR